MGQLIKYLKTNTSKWTLIFDNEEIEVYNILDENLVFCPNGDIEFVIQSNIINDKLINLVKSGRNISALIQEESYVDFSETVGKKQTRDVEHRFMTIKSVAVKSLKCNDIMEVFLSNT